MLNFDADVKKEKKKKRPRVTNVKTANGTVSQFAAKRRVLPIALIPYTFSVSRWALDHAQVAVQDPRLTRRCVHVIRIRMEVSSQSCHQATDNNNALMTD